MKQLSFVAGWLDARSLRVDGASRTSLMFGLGMNNNGTALVLASMTLADHPRVMLPIVFYLSSWSQELSSLQ